MKKRLLLCLLALMIVFSVLVGCSEVKKLPEETMKITGFEDCTQIAFTPAELKDLPTYDGKVEGTDSEGTPVIYQVKGAYLKDLLKKNGKDIKDIEGLRLVATDGYSIEVLKDIIQSRDIILGYEMDGAPLDDRNAPMRVFIPEERAMYWVRMISEIVVLREKSAQDIRSVYMLETLTENMELEDYKYVKATYKAINTEEFLKQYYAEGEDTVMFVSVDGLEKHETLDNLKKGVIKVEGTFSPMFTSDILPMGMHVKDILLIQYGPNAFLSVVKGLEKCEPLSLKRILDISNMGATDQYVLKSMTDDLQVAADELEGYIVKIDEEGVVSVYEDAKDELVIEGLLSINQ